MWTREVGDDKHTSLKLTFYREVLSRIVHGMKLKTQNRAFIVTENHFDWTKNNILLNWKNNKIFGIFFTCSDIFLVQPK